MMERNKIETKLGFIVVWRKQRLQLQVGMFVSQNYLHLLSCAGNTFFFESCLGLNAVYSY